MTRQVEIAANGLRHLIDVSRDAELAYKRAARLARSTELAAIFVKFGLRHQEQSHTLRKYVKLSVNTIQHNPGTVRGKGRREWMALRARFNVERDRVLLQELSAVEARTIAHYEHVIAEARLPEHIDKQIHHQLEDSRRYSAWLRRAERAPERAAKIAKRRVEVLLDTEHNDESPQPI